MDALEVAGHWDAGPGGAGVGNVQTSRSLGSRTHVWMSASLLRTLELGCVAQSLSAEPVDRCDESFAYGSDAGYRIRCVPEAMVQHDYGTPHRQRRRSCEDGTARTHPYSKHRSRRPHILHNDPLVIVYPLLLLTLISTAYPVLPFIPAWQNRSRGGVRVLTAHLWCRVGVLAELAGR